MEALRAVSEALVLCLVLCETGVASQYTLLLYSISEGQLQSSLLPVSCLVCETG
jgi:hypothetical protein